ncbi:1-deoxy-D-xylulose-5-phosphate synthase [Stackebrandtia nassauensis]|uniref:1-deoxy-D-xylulose-5-phosphate synthase n=1 Tax=Stackebrandtia nassauensis (strain DSM 44728 / CIP 108903 / NRRL B-16338 / NBRC 102104 / LLR-40K-21) TaxID=446470 RepID=D3PZL7_STANL|nr:1-deoxy-D-xylulose-5-phosphate synthase [Stackebrandtia nassauensis]ADD41691.1 deoxyxylulose-5-phosphate synthase [Stackebrandtia nassauensis DSM 44728]
MTPDVLSLLAEPGAVRALAADRLPALAAEIRAFLVDRVCRTGGHLGPNLGVVELTIALHRRFDSPTDAIVFDTGHQSYVHKILTGRARDFGRLRQRDGLSGYPSRAESPHDLVENSHASTALSYADGLARVFALRGQSERYVVAVAGDGAMTGGLCWEAMNNIATAGHERLVIVLNDNARSYSPTVGGFAEHLRRLRSGDADGSMFGQLGLDYLGPVDGHDLAALDAALAKAKRAGRPTVVHVVTTKGHGHEPSERDEADCLHAVGVVDPDTGRPVKPTAATWTDVFGEEIAAIGETRQDVVCLTAAMLRPVGLAAFASRFPERVVDVGIAEQHAVCSAAGMATAGAHPVVCVYSTFLNRAFDQVVMDVALHRLPVTFVLDRAGVTGPDGPSHHGMWDSAVLPVVPGLRVAAPRDAAGLRELLREAVDVDDGPTAIRFPKASAGEDIPAVARVDGIDVLHRGSRSGLDVLLVAAGVMAGPCLDAARRLEAEGIGVTVVDPRWIAPVHPTLPHLAARHRLVVTVEDGNRTGGMGVQLAQACADAAVATPVRNLGLPRRFLEHGVRGELLAAYGLDGESVARHTREALTVGVATR